MCFPPSDLAEFGFSNSPFSTNRAQNQSIAARGQLGFGRRTASLSSEMKGQFALDFCGDGYKDRKKTLAPNLPLARKLL